MAPLTASDREYIDYLCREHVPGEVIAKSLVTTQRGSRAAVYRCIKRFRLYGTVNPQVDQNRGRPKVITPEIRDFLLDELIADGTVWQAELQERVAMLFGVWVSQPSISRCISSLDFTNKVVQRRASQRDPIARALFEEELHTFRLVQLVYLDEVDCREANAYRRYGFAPRGLPCVDIRHYHKHVKWSVLPALTKDGYLPDPLIGIGGFNQQDFALFVQERVLPYCTAYPGPRSVLIMDNASTHNRELLRELCHARGVLVRFLPSYSPDYNPIELTFHLLKQWMRRNRNTMPIYGELEYEERFGAFLKSAAEQWSTGVDIEALFKRCHVRME